MERAGYRTRLRPTSLNSCSGSQRQRGLRWHARVPAGGATRPCVEAPVATTAMEMGGGARALLRVGLEFPPRATGAGVSQSSWTEGPAFAFRREARGSGAEVTEDQAPCRGPRGDVARTRHRLLSVLFTFSHRPQPPSGLKRLRARRGVGFVPSVFSGPFPSAERFPHPFPLEGPVLSLEVRKRLRRVRRLLFSSPSRPETLKTRDVWPQGDIRGQREGASGAFRGPVPATGCPGSPPPRRPGSASPLSQRASGAAGLSPGMWRRGMCMQMSRARGGAAGAGPGGAHANRMQMKRPVAAEAAAPPSFPDPSPDGGGSGSLGAATLGGHRGTGRRRRKRRRQRRRPRGGGGGFDRLLRRRHGGLIPGGFLD